MDVKEIYSRLTINCNLGHAFTLSPETLISEYHKLLAAIISIEEKEEFKRVGARLEVSFTGDESFDIMYKDKNRDEREFNIPCTCPNYTREILMELMKDGNK